MKFSYKVSGAQRVIIAVALALLLLGPSLLRLALNVWLGAIATGLGFALVALASSCRTTGRHALLLNINDVFGS